MQQISFVFICMMLIGGIASCSEKSDKFPTVSFRRPVYILPASENLEVEVRLSEPATQNLSVAFQASGNAEEGEDYTLSAHEFLVPAGTSSATISISPLNNIKTDREIHLTLQETTGYDFGPYKQTMIPVETKNSFTSVFFSDNYYLYQETELAAQLFIGSDKYEYPSYDITIPFELDPSSTAVPGTHFEIEGGKQELLYLKDAFLGKVKLRFLKKEEGKDQIVLRLTENDNFLVGDTRNRAYITINGPITFNDLVGSWKFKEFSSLKYISEITSQAGNSEDLKHMPEGSSSDIITFASSGEKKWIETSQLTGDLANYFCDRAEITLGAITDEQMYEANEWGLHRSILKTIFSKVNTNFSATQQKVRPAEVDIRVLEKGNTLEIRIVDYEPTDFLTTTYKEWSDPNSSLGDDNFDPKYPMKGKYTLVFRFTKI